MAPLLEFKDVSMAYHTIDQETPAISHLTFSVSQGEFVAIVGTSGSGKSTLLHMLGGLDRPTEGTVTVDGQEIFALKEEALTIFRRRKIGFVFQAFNLVPVLNVYENIVLPIELDGGKINKAFVGQIVQTLGLKKSWTRCPASSPAGSSSGWPLPGLWRRPRPSFWQTSQPVIWTARPVRMY